MQFFLGAAANQFDETLNEKFPLYAQINKLKKRKYALFILKSEKFSKYQFRII